MLDFVRQHWNLIAGIGIPVLLLIVAARGLINSGLLAKFKLPTLGGSSNASDFAALERLRLRFETQKCSAGVAKCDELLTLFFHHDEEQHP